MKEEGEEEKEKGKRKEEEEKRCIRPVRLSARLCQYKNSPPQAMPAAGVAIFKGHFTIHQITKKQLPCGFSWLLMLARLAHRFETTYFHYDGNLLIGVDIPSAEQVIFFQEHWKVNGIKIVQI